MPVHKGDQFTWERTFTEEEIRKFGELTGDLGIHHTEKDENGRLMVHGLLTASIGTKIGGDLHYIAREMTSRFLRPVFSGDTITCELQVTDVTQKEGFSLVEVTSIYKNQNGKEVLSASSEGIIRDK
ncbi:FAS1-like dehydratase domain-containing protein [Jeotgalibacillus campisalis]|uniref:MaoC like domain-containing protein n=1 Tax=Jeotgalibacillus campisalis TaxID=220754 RepID=A0A0C2S4W9_9BACL|nr:MaoC family dehydratase N-terminal domain-containing protein [Jeotgalibacillus campisalis]KIL49049.1 MaoC like domain-containing protein [Jeotgalibacillus campisalis]